MRLIVISSLFFLFFFNTLSSSSSSSSRDNMNTWPLSLRPSPHSIGIYTYFKGLQCMHIVIFLIKVIYQSS